MQISPDDTTKREFDGVISRWKLFLRLIISPTSVIGIILILFLGILSTTSLTTTGTVIVTILLTIFSGIVGGILADRWNNYMRETKEELRIVHLLRELLILFRSINQIQTLVEHMSKEKVNDDYIIHQLTRIGDSATTSQDIVESIIDHWSGFLPDENAIQIINNIESLRHHEDQVTDDIEQLQNELESAEKRAEEKAEREQELENKLEKKRKELTKIRQNISHQEDDLEDVLEFGTPNIIDSDVASFTDDVGTCIKCGNERDQSLIGEDGVCAYCNNP